MSASIHARWCRLSSRAYGAVVAIAALVACEQGTNEGAVSPTTNKPRPPDVTEVTMEVTPFDASAPEPNAAPVATPTIGKDDPSDDPNIGGPQPPELEKSVAAIRPRLRACYKKALAGEPSLAGTAMFDATLGKDGRVSSARFVKRDGLNDDMVGCLLTAVKAATFDGGGKSQIFAFAFGSGAGAKSPDTSSADAGAKH